MHAHDKSHAMELHNMLSRGKNAIIHFVRIPNIPVKYDLWRAKIESIFHETKKQPENTVWKVDTLRYQCY